MKDDSNRRLHVPPIIAHAGGLIESFGYTNSLEAIHSSVANGFKFVELDVVQLSDGYAIAHDATEEKFYGLTRKFQHCTLAEYELLRVMGRFTPMTFSKLAKLASETPRVRWILDTKFSTAKAYASFLEYLGKTFHRLSGVCIPQVYNPTEAAIARRNGFDQVLFALWKEHHGDPLSDRALDAVRAVKALDVELFGVSLRCFQDRERKVSHLADARLSLLQQIGAPILLHDLGGLDKNRLVQQGFGLFSHSASDLRSFLS